MSTTTILLSSTLGLLLIAACSSGHPTVSEGSVPPPSPPSIPTEQQDGDEASGPTAAPTKTATNDEGPCVPHSKRDCLKSAKVGGRSLCFKTEQVCKADGTSWHPCGENISLGSE